MLESNIDEEDLASDEEVFPSMSETENETFTTSFGKINAYDVLSSLTNQAIYHAVTKDTFKEFYTDNEKFAINVTNGFEVYNSISTDRYGRKTYYGILIDTGASSRSTAGYSQYLAYKDYHEEPSDLNKEKAGEIKVRFGIGETSSIGSAMISLPIGYVEFHIVNADIPFLLCLGDMDRLQVRFDNLNNVLIQDGKAHPVTRRFGHPFAFLTTMFTDGNCFLSTQELRQLHRRFGHPSANRLFKLLDRSHHEIERSQVENLTKFCKTCQKHGNTPKRFKFTLRDDSIDFNHSISVDIMYINGNPVLHVIDEATRFQAARWLPNISSQATWDALRLCWIDIYVGPPDQITHDAGSNFTSQEFRQNATTMAIETKCVPVEAHHSIGIIERYHAPLRRAFEVIKEDLKDLETATSKEVILQMAVKAVNDTAGPYGLVPTLLVFGCYPRMTKDGLPSPSISRRALAIRKAMTEVAKLRNDRQITDALRLRNGPITDSIKALPLNSNVLVWRENASFRGWKGPFKLISIDENTCVVELPNGPTNFRITSVKPYIDDDQPHKENQINSDQVNGGQESPLNLRDNIETIRRENPARNRQRPKRYRNNETTVAIITDTYTVTIKDQEWSTQISEARHKELTDLIENKVFKITNKTDVPGNVRIFGSKWVDTIKNEGTPKAFAKARLVVQAYNDEGKYEVLTQSPTIQRVSQRVILSIAASVLDSQTSLYLRDISQAYVQSTTKINREFYVRPPPELDLQCKLLKIEKPLYGIPEAGNHWFVTYQTHHVKNL